MMDLPLGFRVSGCFGTKHPIKIDIAGPFERPSVRARRACASPSCVLYEAHYVVVCRIPRMCMCAARAVLGHMCLGGPDYIGV